MSKRKKIEQLIAKINEIYNKDYEVSHSSAYTYPYRIRSNNGSHDVTERLTPAECLTWCKGVLHVAWDIER